MADGVTIERPDLGPEHPVREALSTPYTLKRWGEDLRHLADGIPTGFDALEAVRLRWLPGKLYGIAARPGGGKTAFLLEACLRYLEANPDKHALFLSWEEPVAEVVLRLVLREDARQTTPNDGKAFNGPVIFRETVRSFGRDPNGPLFGPDTGTRLATATKRLEGTLSRLHVVDGDALGHDIRAVLHEVAEWMRDAGTPRLGLVAVDYFQKLRGPGDGRFFSRQAELQLVADYLRRFAKGARLPANGDTDAPDPAHAVPVLVGAQVTRGQGEHPSGDSIREADDLLNDAAGVLALSWERTGGDDADEERTLRLSVPKNRDGRARPDEVARIPWRPARGFLATHALADSGGRITWQRIETAKAEGNGKGAKKPRRVVD
jgi:replicative DNA helicase